MVMEFDSGISVAIVDRVLVFGSLAINILILVTIILSYGLE